MIWRRLVTHAVALTALFYAWRSVRVLAGWVRIPVVETIAHAPALSIVVPARNEERNIEACVRSLLAQQGVDAEVIVVDDGSVDATAVILERLQREFPALRLIAGEPLPAGWVGKPWACTQGARAARGDWLLFTDADSRHQPHASASTLAFALAQRADALSIMTGQDLGSPAEAALLPAILQMIVFASGPIDEINDPQRPDRALANGQYLLVSRNAYDALGGHAALRDELVEDIAFARRIKGDGRFRFVVAEGTQLVRVRMYRSLREIWDGFTKNMYLGARGDLRAIAGGVAFCAALSVAPPLLALASLRRGERRLAAEAVAASLLVMAVGARGATYVSIPRRLAVFAPLGIGMFAAIALNSTRRALCGAGFTWRGRVYPAKNDAR
ncbi:MAG: glycosyltransferase family 2 protein [Candidatus Lustribacter sp.]|jgi:chlorobactene glucosyltransferase